MADLLQRTSEQAAAQRAVRDESQTEVPQRGDDLQLDGAGGEVVDALLRHQAHEVAGGSDALCGGDLPAGEVAATEVDHLAGSHKLLHRLPDLLPWRASVDVVHLVQVDVVGPQSTQAVLASLADVVSREATIVGSGAHRLVQLGGEHDLVATAAGLGQPAADVLLRDPVTLLHVRATAGRRKHRRYRRS